MKIRPIALALIYTAVLAAPTAHPAQARGLDLLAGLVVGAVIGAVVAPPVYAQPTYYPPTPVYVDPVYGPVYGQPRFATPRHQGYGGFGGGNGVAPGLQCRQC